MPQASADRLIKIAACILATYGLAVVANATVWQTLGGWQDARDFGRAIVRLVGMGLIAWGLLSRRRWAWWFAIILPSFWVITGTAGLTAYLVFSDPDMPPMFPRPMAWFLAASFVALAISVVILLRPEVRSHFKASSTSS